MTVWTISAQEGSGGEHVAAELAAAADVPLIARDELAVLAHEIDPDNLAADEFADLEERFGGRFTTVALGMALTGPAAADARRELDFRHRLPEVGRAVLTEAVRRPCVILAPPAFAALRDHPTAIHVRLHAPHATRVAAYQREHVVERSCAEKAIAHCDHVQHDWVRSLYQVELSDDRLFALVLDTSRFTRDRLVETLLAAGGLPARLPIARSTAAPAPSRASPADS
jgi:hypothetical protein